MKTFRPLLSAAVLSGLLVLSLPVMAETAVSPKAVMEHYTQLAHATFEDSLQSAKTLQKAIYAFLAEPSTETHQAAKDAWRAARDPYGQTEAFRFGNANVDDWEGQVNAWPLDEGLIDYIKQDAYEAEEGNDFAQANIIAGDEPITKESLRAWHEKGGSEANVATGYHAIEFLLWGQDLNAKPTDSGQRPYTDFILEGCTNKHCARRATYLKVASDLLVEDLQDMVDDWAKGKDNYRKAFLALNENEALRRMLFGMGSLSLGELAGERMNVALLAHSQEEEHSCFSDNTQRDIVENARAIQNIYLGSYQRLDGSKLEGPSLEQLAASKDKAVADALTAKLATTQEKVEAIAKAVAQGENFDQQILPDNTAGNKRIKAAITALRDQTGSIAEVATLLGVDELNPESSDSFNE